jgi:rubredoxin
MVKCPNCNYAREPEPHWMSKWFKNEEVKWSGDQEFENIGFQTNMSHIIAHQCPKCQLIFFETLGEKFYKIEPIEMKK